MSLTNTFVQSYKLYSTYLVFSSAYFVQYSANIASDRQKKSIPAP